jgi:cytochrome c oxidase assembly factor CtaG
VLTPASLWSAWNLSPLLLSGLALAGFAHWRGRLAGPRRPADRWRSRGFALGLGAVFVALVSPLDALAGALASAHMVQHVLLVLVAAPLLALSAPGGALLRGSPLPVRRALRWRRAPLVAAVVHGVGRPVPAWLLHVAALWFWHAAVPYDAALRSEAVHVLEHATFLGTALLFWHAVAGPRGAGRASPGLGLLLVFAMALQSVFLSVLLTFARTPWYAGYATTTAAWGLDPLADQQLAGAIMWIPAGLVHVGAGLALLVALVRAGDRPVTPLTPPRARAGRSPSPRSTG